MGLNEGYEEKCQDKPESHELQQVVGPVLPYMENGFDEYGTEGQNPDEYDHRIRVIGQGRTDKLIPGRR